MKLAMKPLAACMATMFGVTSFSVWGAPPAPPPIQNQNAPQLATSPMMSVFPTQPKEFPGIPWGSFLVFPDVSLSVTHDDNIYAERPYSLLDRTSVTEDVIYTLSPSIEVKSNWTKHELNFDLGGDFDRYQNNDSEDVNDYWMGFDGHYDLSARTNIFGGARYSHDHEDRSTPGSLVSQAQIEPTLYDHEEAHLGLAHSFGAFRLRVGGTWDQYDYEDGELPIGATVDNDYRDHDLSSLGVRLGYVVSPKYEIFGQFATDNREYDNLINLQAFNRDSDGYRAAAGMRFTLQPQRLAGEVFAGVMSQDYDHNGFSDLSKPYFGALAVWKPTAQVTATGFIDRTLEETTVYRDAEYASGSLDTTYGFEVEHRLTSKLMVSGRAAYTKSDFQNFDRNDNIIDAGAGLRYYVQPTVYLGADLRVVDRDSNDLDGQYSNNQVMVSVGYTPARNRDYAIIPEREAGAPATPGAQGVYSGFYLGAQLGYGGLTTATEGETDDGYEAAGMGGLGASYGLFAGWGTEINNWYFGVEIDGGDSDADWSQTKSKSTSTTVSVDKDTGYGLSARAGYLLDGGLLYGKLGVVVTDFHTYYTANNNAAGAFDEDHSETGTRLGLGLEIPASRNLFVRTDYSYTQYDDYGVAYTTLEGDSLAQNFDTSDSVFSIGLGWRFGGERPAVATRSAAELRGLYAGASLGHGTLGTEVSGTQMDQQGTQGPFDFTGDFAHTGFTGGFFAGYGHTFNQVYVGLELEAEAANFGWTKDQVTVHGPGGRDFAADKRGGYGASLRLGYALPNGGLLYGRIGAVETRFNTIYYKGGSANNWINRSDTLDGTRFGLGAEIPATENTFVRMDYTYTRYNDTVDFVTTHAGGTNSDDMSFDNTESLVRLGLGFRF